MPVRWRKVPAGPVKVIGQDSGQVTSWTSWHRWPAISLLACIFLALAVACQRARDGSAAIPGLIPVTAAAAYGLTFVPNARGTAESPKKPSGSYYQCSTLTWLTNDCTKVL
jgi:hypothetical protein